MSIDRSLLGTVKEALAKQAAGNPYGGAGGPLPAGTDIQKTKTSPNTHLQAIEALQRALQRRAKPQAQPQPQQPPMANPQSPMQP